MDLGISLALPSIHPWTASIGRLYSEFVGCIADVLERFGIDVDISKDGGARQVRGSHLCFENRSQDSLLIEGRKILGCAQARKSRAALVHGALLLGLSSGLQSRVFGVPEERIEAAMAPVSLPGGATGFLVKLVDEMAARLGVSPSFEERQERKDGTRGYPRGAYGKSSDIEQGRSLRIGSAA
jgi:lipoate-protein ligase A